MSDIQQQQKLSLKRRSMLIKKRLHLNFLYDEETSSNLINHNSSSMLKERCFLIATLWVN